MSVACATCGRSADEPTELLDAWGWRRVTRGLIVRVYCPEHVPVPVVSKPRPKVTMNLAAGPAPGGQRRKARYTSTWFGDSDGNR